MGNFAFVDGNNLYKGMARLGWKLDTEKFLEYLQTEFNVEKTFYFTGETMEKSHIEMRDTLTRHGYTIITKPIMPSLANNNIKGNCDGEMILQAMIELNNYEMAVLISSDGDFSCLVKYLRSIGKLGAIIVQRKTKASALLKMCANKY